MIVYHRTPEGAAIISGGFRDSEGYFMTDRLWRGVWLSDMPLDSNEGAKGAELLRIEIPEAEIADYEWIQPEGTYREFLVPADVVNRFGPPVLTDEDAEDLP